jgi:hypothetical protein
MQLRAVGAVLGGRWQEENGEGKVRVGVDSYDPFLSGYAYIIADALVCSGSKNFLVWWKHRGDEDQTDMTGQGVEMYVFTPA